MHDHRSHADRFHEDDVQEDVMNGGGILHQTPSEFDHGGLAAEPANPSHRFNQRVGFGNCFVHT